jgi:hypothetical protein
MGATSSSTTSALSWRSWIVSTLILWLLLLILLSLLLLVLQKCL